MALSPALQAGLSNATRNLQNGNLQRQYSAGQSPAEAYARYRNDSAPLQFVSFPPDMPDYSMVLVGRDYGIGGTFTSTGRATAGVQLPMPQMKLTDRYQVAYDDNYSFLAQLEQYSSALALVGRGLQLAGFNINKFKSVLLQTPELKRHEFIWKLSPKTWAESQQIHALVETIKAGMAPNLINASTTLDFPLIWDVYFNGNFHWMYGMKPAVIESIEVDYAGGNPHPTFLYNGAPETVTLNLNLLEIEFWVRQDFVNFRNATSPVVGVRPSTFQELVDRARQQRESAQQAGQSPVVTNDGGVGQTNPGIPGT